MFNPNWTLAEMLELADPSQIPTAPVGFDHERVAQQIDEQEAAFCHQVSATARQSGRPNKVTPRRITEVRGLRLEAALWANLEQEAEKQDSSINRLIEESILQRLGLMDIENKTTSAEVFGSWMSKNYNLILSQRIETVTYKRQSEAA